jgi:hypothetical protein
VNSLLKSDCQIFSPPSWAIRRALYTDTTLIPPAASTTCHKHSLSAIPLSPTHVFLFLCPLKFSCCHCLWSWKMHRGGRSTPPPWSHCLRERTVSDEKEPVTEVWRQETKQGWHTQVTTDSFVEEGTLGLGAEAAGAPGAA